MVNLLFKRATWLSSGVTRIWNRGIMHAPEKYEMFKSVARRDIEESVPILISKMSAWKPKELVLDYGCGAGSTGNKFFVPLAEASDSLIHAVDISPEMIEFAKEKFANPRVEFFQGNLLDDGFILGSNQYDRIFSIYVFHYIQEYKAGLKKFHALLKPGAEFGFTVLGRSLLFDIYKIVGEDPRFKVYTKGYENFVPAWYKEEPSIDHAMKCFKDAVTELGFEILHSQIHYQKNVQVLSTALELYIALNPFVNNIPADLMPDFRQAIKDGICKLRQLPPGVESYNTEHEMLSFVVKKAV